MPRAIDHLVLVCHDLDAAGARFAELGFTVGPINSHPWGTQNRLIQFSDETFLELITIGDWSRLSEAKPGEFSFGAFIRDALARRTGLAMLALKSADARADAARFSADGIGDFAPFDFARKGIAPDGTATQVAFSLAFARDAAMPEIGFFTCQQHFPQNFWAPALQQHANGARGIARISLIAENPADHHIFLSAFCGQRALRATSFGIEAECGSGIVEIVTARGFEFRYGAAAPEGAQSGFAGIALAGPGPATTTPVGSRALIDASAAFNTIMVWEGGK